MSDPRSLRFFWPIFQRKLRNKGFHLFILSFLSWAQNYPQQNGNSVKKKKKEEERGEYIWCRQLTVSAIAFAGHCKYSVWPDSGISEKTER